MTIEDKDLFTSNINEERQLQFWAVSRYNAELRQWIQENPDKLGKDFFQFSESLKHDYWNRSIDDIRRLREIAAAEFTAARFLENLGMLLTNGLGIKQSLAAIQQCANPYLRTHIIAMEYRLTGSENVSDVLNTGLIDSADIVRLHLSAQEKNVEQALFRLGLRAIQQSHQRIVRFCSISAAVLLVASAGLAALIIFSIYGVGAAMGQI